MNKKNLTLVKEEKPRTIFSKKLIAFYAVIFILLIGIIKPFLTKVTFNHANNTMSSKIHTVFVITMENHNWSTIKNNSSAVYINETILPMASYAQAYYNPPSVHPSLPNYLWLEAGSNLGVTNDNIPQDNHQQTRQHLVTLLQHAGFSWKSYQEGVSGTECPLTVNGLYAPKHNPMVYFDDITNTNMSTSATCIAHVRPFAELASDIKRNSVPQYNFITPNLCNDMHDSTGCPTDDSIKNGDTWLQKNLPTILNSPVYKREGVIFIVWDEGEAPDGSNNDGPIGMIVLSPFAKGHGYSTTIRYTHSSTVRTIEEIFGLSPFLGDAANATDLHDLFLDGAIPRK